MTRPRRLPEDTAFFACALACAMGCGGCAGCEDKGRTKPIATASATASAASTAAGMPSASPSTSTSASTSASAGTGTSTGGTALVFGADAGLACKPQIVRQEMKWVGPAALGASDMLRVVANKQGVPDVATFPIEPVAAQPRALPAKDPAPVYGAGANPCVLASKYAFCMDRDGAIRRTQLDASGGMKVVARAKPSTRFAAAALGAEHVVVAYLDERKTTEGLVWEAFATADDGADVRRLSEDGNGATFVDLASRGSDVVALLVDARAALTLVHARVLAWEKDRLSVAPDTVVFVGGPPERRTAGALAVGKADPSFGLLPMPSDDGFGLAVIRIDKAPVVDAPVVWSKYPNGLDPAPIAATRGATPIRVARVRPAERAPDSPRVVELGKLEPDGTFVSQGPLVRAKKILDLAVEADRFGALWVYYTADDKSFLERVACP